MNFRFLSWGILLSFCFSSFGQDGQVKEFGSDIEDNQNQEMMMVSGVNIQSQQINSKNKVYIQQVGEGNFTTANITAEKSNLHLIQTGSDNFIGLLINVKSIEGTVIQDGDNNFAFDLANDPTMNISLNVSQNGNGHHFESHGTNSIGNKLKFEMTGENNSIIVRNFK